MGWEILLIDTTRGDHTPRTFSTSVVRIGRNPDNEVILKHGQISRLHLTLTKDGEQFFAEDSSEVFPFPMEYADHLAEAVRDCTVP